MKGNVVFRMWSVLIVLMMMIVSCGETLITDVEVKSADGSLVVSWVNLTAEGGEVEVWYGVDGNADTKFEGEINSESTIITGLSNDVEYTVVIKKVGADAKVLASETSKATPVAGIVIFPLTPIVSGVATSTSTSRPTWNFVTATGSLGIGKFEVKLNDKDFSAGAEETTKNSWQPATALVDGSYTLYVRESDGSNWSEVGEWTTIIAVNVMAMPNVVFASGVKTLESGGKIYTDVVKPSFTLTSAEPANTASFKYKFNTDTVWITAVKGVDIVSGVDLTHGAQALQVVAVDNSGKNSAIKVFEFSLDLMAPAPCSIAFAKSIISEADNNSIDFSVGSAEMNATYNYSIDDTDSGTAAIAGTGTVASLSFDITALDLSGLKEGDLTLTFSLTDGFGQKGNDVTAVIKNDLSAPNLGNGGSLSISRMTTYDISVNWTAASDAVVSASDLQYKVYYSSTNNIDSVANATANGTAPVDWASFTGTQRFVGLSFLAQSGYYNVLVKDTRGHVACSTMINSSAATNLIAYYSLDWKDATDLSGQVENPIPDYKDNIQFDYSPHTGILESEYESDRFGNSGRAYSVDDCDEDWVALPNLTIHGKTEYTMAGWFFVNEEARTLNQRVYFYSITYNYGEDGDSNREDSSLSVHWQTASGKSNINLQVNTDKNSSIDVSNFNYEAWNHLVVTRTPVDGEDHPQYFVYVNGVQYDFGKFGGNDCMDSGADDAWRDREDTRWSGFLLGEEQDGLNDTYLENNQDLNGALDDFRVYSTPLSQAEATALYNSEKP